jgi:hypothetical protein
MRLHQTFGLGRICFQYHPQNEGQEQKTRQEAMTILQRMGQGQDNLFNVHNCWEAMTRQITACIGGMQSPFGDDALGGIDGGGQMAVRPLGEHQTRRAR